MSTRLIQTVAFTNVAAGATVSLPHNINVNQVAKVPDFVATDAPGFTAAATASEVTVTNNGTSTASVNVWLELKHTIPRELGGLANLVPQPFVVANSSGGGGGGGDNDGATALVDDGGILTPVAGPFRPYTQAWFFDDFLTDPANTFVLKSANTTVTYNSLNIPGGPGGNYLGTAELMIDFGNAGAKYISLTHGRNQTSSPTNQFLRLSDMAVGSEVWVCGGIGFESSTSDIWSDGGGDKAFTGIFGFTRYNDFSTWSASWAGFYLYPKSDSTSNTWFFRVNTGGSVDLSIDTGVPVVPSGTFYKAAHNLIVRMQKHAPLSGGEDVTISAYIDGVQAATAEISWADVGYGVGSIAAFRRNSAGASENMYVDYFGLAVHGRYQPT